MMEFKIDIKIFLIALVFLLVNQIYMYILFMIFAIIHECFHLLAGIILGYKVKSIRIMPLGLSIAFNEKEEDYNCHSCGAAFARGHFLRAKKHWEVSGAFRQRFFVRRGKGIWSVRHLGDGKNVLRHVGSGSRAGLGRRISGRHRSRAGSQQLIRVL